MQGIRDRSYLDGRLHHGRHIQSGTDEMAILERGWRGERIRLGEESWLKQQHLVRRGRIIQSGTDEMAILERGWRGERIRLGEESWLKQQHLVRRGRIPIAGQTVSKIG